MTKKDIYGQLVREASVLLQWHHMPSDIADDYHQKTYSARKVAKMMEKAHENARLMAIRLKGLADAVANL